MNYLLRSLLFIAPSSLILGIAWTLFSIEQDQLKKQRQAENFITVLAPKGYLPLTAISNFASKHDVGVRLYEAKSRRELALKAVDTLQPFDIIILPTQIQQGISESASFLPLPEKLTKASSKLISADFRVLDSQRMNYYIPHSWYASLWMVRDSTFNDDLDFRDALINPKNQNKITLFNDGIEYFDTLLRFNLIDLDWFEAEQANKIVHAAHLAKRQGFSFIDNPSESDIKSQNIVQLKHSSKLIDSKNIEGFKLLFPEEKIKLNIFYIALGRSDTSISKKSLFVNWLLNTDIAQDIATHNLYASTLRKVIMPENKKFLQANYLRELPLGKIETTGKPFVHSPTWIEAITELGVDH